MASVDAHLVRRADGLVLLFDPPFDTTPLDPGYVKGYPPGVRENGGQYTHAAIWTVLAAAGLGQGDRAHELFSLLNPIRHAATREDVQRYKVEPYVLAGDVYSRPPHVGRGGWTWYTGSAGWMYRAGIEGILGIRLRGAALEIDPCIPRAWPAFEIVLRYRSSRTRSWCRTRTASPVAWWRWRWTACLGRSWKARGWDPRGWPSQAAVMRIPLVDDKGTHKIRVGDGLRGD
jgi:cyclic beta-1,2-glucan synthetase